MMRKGTAWLGLALALANPAGRGMAQEALDLRWLPWLGCWQPVEAEVEGLAAAPEAKQAYFCVRPGTGGVEIVTVVDGAPVASRALVADGSRHAVSEDGCTGWQRAQWSADGQRLFVASEVTCEGGVVRSASGLMAMLTPAEWVDAHAAGFGAERAARAIRYRPAPGAVAEQAGVELPAFRFGQVADARRLAASPLSLDDVTEAARAVDATAVEAFLFERGEGFELKADRIAGLADAGVPASVIDLMVALSYPRVFSLNRERLSGDFAPPERGLRDDRYYGRDRYRDYCWGRGFYSSYCSPFGYMPFGWSYGFYNPWDYGYGGYGGYGGWGYGRPIIVVEPDGPGDAGGRAVKGQGYTRTNRGTASGSGSGRMGPDRSSTSGGGASGGSSSGAGSSASGGSSGSGGSSSGRTAVRRGGGL